MQLALPWINFVDLRKRNGLAHYWILLLPGALLWVWKVSRSSVTIRQGWKAWSLINPANTILVGELEHVLFRMGGKWKFKCLIQLSPYTARKFEGCVILPGGRQSLVPILIPERVKQTLCYSVFDVAKRCMKINIPIKSHWYTWGPKEKLFFSSSYLFGDGNTASKGIFKLVSQPFSSRLAWRKEYFIFKFCLCLLILILKLHVHDLWDVIKNHTVVKILLFVKPQYP